MSHFVIDEMKKKMKVAFCENRIMADTWKMKKFNFALCGFICKNCLECSIHPQVQPKQRKDPNNLCQEADNIDMSKTDWTLPQNA